MTTSFYFGRFPILCLTDEPGPQIPATFLVLSHYFNDFFSFGLVRKSGVGAMRMRFKNVPEPEVNPGKTMCVS